jgi:hypothetical protein
MGNVQGGVINRYYLASRFRVFAVKDFIVLMHDDAIDNVLANAPLAWESYLQSLQASGCFGGGSAIGSGETFRKRVLAKATSGLNGFVRLRCVDLAKARALLEGNPAFEAGATVEIRELPQDDPSR